MDVKSKWFKTTSRVYYVRRFVTGVIDGSSVSDGWTPAGWTFLPSPPPHRPPSFQLTLSRQFSCDQAIDTASGEANKLCVCLPGIRNYPRYKCCVRSRTWFVFRLPALFSKTGELIPDNETQTRQISAADSLHNPWTVVGGIRETRNRNFLFLYLAVVQST